MSPPSLAFPNRCCAQRRGACLHTAGAGTGAGGTSEHARHSQNRHLFMSMQSGFQAERKDTGWQSTPIYRGRSWRHWQCYRKCLSGGTAGRGTMTGLNKLLKAGGIMPPSPPFTSSSIGVYHTMTLFEQPAQIKDFLALFQ